MRVINSKKLNLQAGNRRNSTQGLVLKVKASVSYLAWRKSRGAGTKTGNKEKKSLHVHCHLVEGIFVATLIHQRLELAILDVEEFAWLAEFDDVPGIKNHLRPKSGHHNKRKSYTSVTHNFVGIHDCL